MATTERVVERVVRFPKSVKVMRYEKVVCEGSLRKGGPKKGELTNLCTCINLSCTCRTSDKQYLRFQNALNEEQNYCGKDWGRDDKEE